MEDEYFLGKRVVRVDGHIAYQGRTILSDHSGLYEFDLGGGPAFLHIRTNGFRYFYDVIIDERSISTGAPLDIELARQPPSSTTEQLIGGLAVMISVLVLLLFAGPQIWNDVRLTVDGKIVDANVISRTIVPGRNPSPQIGYAFPIDDVVYTGRMFVSDDDYRRLHLGDAVRVVYLRSDPSINQRPRQPIEQLLGAGIIALVVWGAVSGAREVRRGLHARGAARRLRQRGVDTDGTVTGAFARRGRGFAVIGFNLSYDYTDEAGVARHGRSTAAYGLGALLRWPVGSRVRIRIDPERPADSEFLG